MYVSIKSGIFIRTQNKLSFSNATNQLIISSFQTSADSILGIHTTEASLISKLHIRNRIQVQSIRTTVRMSASPTVHHLSWLPKHRYNKLESTIRNQLKSEHTRQSSMSDARTMQNSRADKNETIDIMLVPRAAKSPRGHGK